MCNINTAAHHFGTLPFTKKPTSGTPAQEVRGNVFDSAPKTSLETSQKFIFQTATEYIGIIKKLGHLETCLKVDEPVEEVRLVSRRRLSKGGVGEWCRRTFQSAGVGCRPPGCGVNSYTTPTRHASTELSRVKIVAPKSPPVLLTIQLRLCLLFRRLFRKDAQGWFFDFVLDSKSSTVHVRDSQCRIRRIFYRFYENS